MEIIKWITYEEAGDKPQNGIGGMGGFFKDGMRWKDYYNQFNKEGKKLLKVLRKSILKNGIRCTGEEAQNGYAAIPLWDNGNVDTYTWRAWGDLMAAVYSEKEKKDYNYMDFYM